MKLLQQKNFELQKECLLKNSEAIKLVVEEKNTKITELEDQISTHKKYAQQMEMNQRQKENKLKADMETQVNKRVRVLKEEIEDLNEQLVQAENQSKIDESTSQVKMFQNLSDHIKDLEG